MKVAHEATSDYVSVVFLLLTAFILCETGLDFLLSSQKVRACENLYDDHSNIHMVKEKIYGNTGS